MNHLSKEHLIGKSRKWNLKRISVYINLNLCMMFKLKKQDESDRKLCYFRRFCRIFHGKHNWKKSLSNKTVKEWCLKTIGRNHYSGGDIVIVVIIL